MTYTTIKEIGSMEAGDPVLRMKATVESSFAPYNGSNQYGDYSVQAVILKDDTGKIRASFWNPVHDFRKLRGSEIEIVSGKDGKGRFSGITAIDYEDRKKNVVERQIKVTEHAKVDETVGDSRPEPDVAGNTGKNVGEPRPAQLRSDLPDYEAIKRVSIERQTSLQMAIEFSKTQEGKTLDSVLGVADKFYEYLSGGKPEAKPEPEREAPADASKVV